MDERVALIEREQHAVEAVLEAVEPAGWQSPTPCEGWTVAHVVAHLAVQADLFAGACENAIGGSAEAPWAEAQAGRQAYHHERDRRIDALVTAGPAATLRSFVETGQRIDTLLEQIKPDDLNRPAWTPPGTGTVEFFLNARLAELAIHGWDIQDGLGISGLMPAELHDLLIGYLISRLPRLMDRAAASDLPADVQFDFGGDGLALIAAPGLATTAPSTASPGATIRTDKEAFIVVVSGRRSVSAMRAVGRWTIEGDQALGERVSGAFTGF